LAPTHSFKQALRIWCAGRLLAPNSLPCSPLPCLGKDIGRDAYHRSLSRKDQKSADFYAIVRSADLLRLVSQASSTPSTTETTNGVASEHGERDPLMAFPTGL
jgi:hypothetical protein